MRFMVIVKANPDSEAGVLPTPELLAEMMKYNEELVKAGVMLSGDGLHASSKGVRVKFSGGKTTVTDGPFTETKELIAGTGAESTIETITDAEAVGRFESVSEADLFDIEYWSLEQAKLGQSSEKTLANAVHTTSAAMVYPAQPPNAERAISATSCTRTTALSAACDAATPSDGKTARFMTT